MIYARSVPQREKSGIATIFDAAIRNISSPFENG